MAAAALERLRASPRPRILFVSHAFGGGVARHLASLARAIEPCAEALLLQPHRESSLALRWLRPGEDAALWFDGTRDWDRLVALLDGIGIDRVHYHHVQGLPAAILALPRRLRCAHRLTLHDYFAACPAYHMTDGAGRYCGGDADCQRCLEAGPAQWPLSIDAWRGEFAAVLTCAERVIAPSRDAAERIARFFPSVSPVVWPHAEEDRTPIPAPLRVLVPGAISPAKGLALLAGCVADAAARRLPLHFRVLGYTAKALGQWPGMPASIAGEYREEDLDALVALERGDAFFFPAQCPETYSYTLSAALATRLPIVATDLGAFPERLAGRANARIVRWDAAPAAVNDVLLAIRVAGEAAPAGATGALGLAEYRRRYMEGLTRVSEAAPMLPPVEPRWLHEPAASPQLSSLAWLFEDAVRCGRGRSLEELRRRVGEADEGLARAEADRAALEEKRSRLAAAEAALDEARQVAARTAAESQALREALRRLESSRSWKLTAPLRVLARRLRRER